MAVLYLPRVAENGIRVGMNLKPKKMSYIFKGNLRGFYCGDCYDYLYRAKVKIYAIDKQADITALAVAREKETFHQRKDDELKSLSKRLLVETETDESGNFTVDFSNVRNYNGEAFEIDFECGTVPLNLNVKRPPKPRGPFQFHITTLQPMWKESGDENNKSVNVAYWEYAITYKFWCWLLRLFGVYVICGRVVDCEKKTPIKGLRVKAFDVDLIQDDYLGLGITDVTGNFKIYYTEADFSKTIFPWLNVEWPAGPDLYFSVESGTGTVIMQEPRNRGHQPDRENASNCFCVELCVKTDGGDGSYAPVLFQKVGQYWITSDFDAVGFTNDAQRNAFTGTIPLIGAVPAPFSSTALEYRFIVKNLDTSVSVIADANFMAPFTIGTWNRIISFFPFNSVSEDYWVNNPAATHNVAIDPQGWIKVPRENDLFGVTGQFSPGITMGALMTEKLIKENFDLINPTVYVAGNPFSASQKASIHHYEITCQVREVGTIPVAYSNVLTRIAVCNTSYLQRLHPAWAGGDVSRYAVVMLELVETTLSGSGCNKITTQVTANYSVVHPVIDNMKIYFEGNAPLPAPFAINPVAGDEAAGSTSPQFDVSALQPCAYIVWLEATFRLTGGYGRIAGSTIWDHIAFCKA